MSPSTNTQSSPTAFIETLSIVPPTPPTSTYLIKYDLDNTIKYIHTEIKAFNKNIHNGMKAMNKNIAAMLVTLINKTDKQNNQEEKTTYLSSKLSTEE